MWKQLKSDFPKNSWKIVLFEIEESGFFQNDLMNPGLFLEKSDLSSFTRIIFMADFKKSNWLKKKQNCYQLWLIIKIWSMLIAFLVLLREKHSN